MSQKIWSPETKSSNTKVVHGQHTTVTANDVIKTGLAEVDEIVACLDSDPVAAAAFVTAVKGSGGNVNIKTWNSTFAAATAFGVKVNWIAIGR
jgi:hypothetical protein